MRKNKILKLMSLALIIGVGSFIINKNIDREVEASSETLTSVMVQTVGEEKVRDRMKYSGRLSYGREENLISMVDEKVTYVGVKEGDLVKKGDVLVKFDSSKIDGSVEKAKKDYEDALKKSNENKKKLEGLKSNIDGIEEEIEKLKGEKQSIELKITELENELKTIEEKFKNNEISEEEYKILKDEKDKLLNENNLRLKVLDKEIDVKELEKTSLEKGIEGVEKLNLGKLSLESTKKIYEQMSTMKENYILKAPIDGVVLSLNCYLNEKVENKMMPSVSIGNKSELNFKFGVDEDEVKKFKENEEVTMEIEKDKKMIKEKGYISSISRKKDLRTGQYTVTVKISNNKDYDVQAFANCFIKNTEKKEKNMISKNALIREEEKNFVYVVEEGKIIKKEIKISEESNHSVKVIEGLEENDKVVIRGKEYIEEGQAVNIVEEDL
ncbi:MAG: HlyD family efflux transporter periplasmic adaptor subunit [Clostridium sp.]|uniref:HlyD family efflux transporter periplasmic adaptor subunit n=1 Tax=Clostridium sp. TaxID=1506 RepID=UPI003F3F770F